MHTAHHDDLAHLLEITRPSSILLIDPNPGALPPALLNHLSECQVTHLPVKHLSELQHLKRHDLGILANTLEQLDRNMAGMLLARLRDCNSRRFVALVPMGDRWQNQISYWDLGDLLGYGLSVMARYQVDGKPLYLYQYAIETYKTTPDWLNSKFWANPERWRP
jgi:hypothetical protein